MNGHWKENRTQNFAIPYYEIDGKNKIMEILFPLPAPTRTICAIGAKAKWNIHATAHFWICLIVIEFERLLVTWFCRNAMPLGITKMLLHFVTQLKAFAEFVCGSIQELFYQIK